MHDISLAFLWHHHQPYYPDEPSDEHPMPWVRLHGTRDYWGMGMLLKRFPQLHATINLLPSLLRQIIAYTEPTGLLNVTIDGRWTFFEWIQAGRYTCRGPRGAMAMACEEPIAECHFGFDLRRLYLRLDASAGRFCGCFGETDRLRIFFFQPEGFELTVHRLDAGRPACHWTGRRRGGRAADVEAAAGRTFELAVPFRDLGVSTGEPIHFFMELSTRRTTVQRIPAEGAIETAVPSPDFEMRMWHV